MNTKTKEQILKEQEELIKQLSKIQDEQVLLHFREAENRVDSFDSKAYMASHIVPPKLVRTTHPPETVHNIEAHLRSKQGPVDIHSRLKKKSEWYKSIMSPISGADVKIPDAVGTNTVTYQHIETVSVPVNALGVAGLRIISPYINSFPGIDPEADPTDGSNYQVTNALSNWLPATTINWSGSSDSIPGAFPFARIPSVMKSSAQGHRVVSCSVTAETELPTLECKGEMCAFVTPFACNDAGINYQNLAKQWDSTIVPVNKKHTLIARWFPLSSDFVPFNTSISKPMPNPPTISYQDFIDPNIGNQEFTGFDNGVLPWELGIICAGLITTGMVRFKIVVNYEFIPKTQSSLTIGEPSPTDPMEEQLVNKWVSDAPITGIISQRQASLPASAPNQKEDKTGLGMLVDVAKEMAPYIKSFMNQ